MESEDEREGRIRVHEYWMAFRRDYHNVKEGHRPKLTHEEVQECMYQMMLGFKKEYKKYQEKIKTLKDIQENKKGERL